MPQYIDIQVGSGGHRDNAGRHRVADPKVQVQFMVHSSVLKKLGGKKKVQELAIRLIYAEVDKMIENEVYKSGDDGTGSDLQGRS